MNVLILELFKDDFTLSGRELARVCSHRDPGLIGGSRGTRTYALEKFEKPNQACGRLGGLGEYQGVLDIMLEDEMEQH